LGEGGKVQIRGGETAASDPLYVATAHRNSSVRRPLRML